ncbi:transcription factor TFIID complex subunit 8 C-term-domain-containing protein [Dipodascopsis uninucleata]
MAERELFVRAIAAILASLPVPCSPPALETLALLAEQYILHLGTTLHKYTTIQRRSKPSLRDAALLLASEGIHTRDLEDELERSSSVTTRLPNFDLSAASTTTASSQRSPSIPAASIVAPSSRNLEYIPPWMPELPADHTYRATPIYSDRVTDPRAIREKIIQEGQLVESALRKLTELQRDHQL